MHVKCMTMAAKCCTQLSLRSKNPCLDATDGFFQKSNDLLLFRAVSLLVSVSTSLEIDNKNFLC